MAFAEQDHYMPSHQPTMSDSCPLVNIIREKHPGCLNTVVGIVDSSKKPLVKGLHSSEYPQLAQALAYVAFRTDGQYVDIGNMARQVRVPIERLRKDVKRISDRLGISSVAPVEATDIADEADQADASGDILAFKKAMVTVLRLYNVASASQVRGINSWCTKLFKAALLAEDVDVINAPSKHSTTAALSLYFQQETNLIGVTKKRKRNVDGKSSDVLQCFVASLTKHATARKVALALRKHISGVGTE
jgi:hypothetical protein